MLYVPTNSVSDISRRLSTLALSHCGPRFATSYTNGRITIFVGSIIFLVAATCLFASLINDIELLFKSFNHTFSRMYMYISNILRPSSLTICITNAPVTSDTLDCEDPDRMQQNAAFHLSLHVIRT